MSYMDVMYGPLGQANNQLQANLGQNAAMNQQQQASMAAQQAAAAQQQAMLNNLYGPQGFGGQTAAYAGAGAAYGRGTGYYGDTSGLPPGSAPLPNGQNGIPGGYPSGVVTSAPMPGVQLDPTPGVGGGAGYWGADSQGYSSWFPSGDDTPATPQQLYSNGGFNPYDPNTFAPSAGFGMGMPQMLGTGSGGYDPQWGGSSIYSKGAQAVPSDWNNWFGQFQGTTGGGPNDYTSGGGWEKEYLLGNQDVFNAAKASGADPIAFADQHYRDYGQNEGRGVFDAQEYLRENPDVWKAGANPFQHYNQYGRDEGRFAPMSGAFDRAGYLAANQDVAAAGVDPLQHWIQYGQKEGRSGGYGGDDAYLMAAGGDYPYGQPTGVGGSGYGDGFGGYGHDWESPYPTPPGANINDPTSYWAHSQEPNAWEASRAPYSTQLSQDPARMYDMAVRLYLELGNDPVGRQGIAEAMLNRNAARGLDPLSAKYFPKKQDYLDKYANATDWLRTQPELLGKIYGEIGRAVGGSNISQGATDWASDVPGNPVASNAAKVSTETWQSPNEDERFFRKDLDNLTTGHGAATQIQNWYRNMQSLQPQWPGS